MTKPYEFRELEPCIKAKTFMNKKNSPKQLRFQSLSICPESRRAEIDGRVLNFMFYAIDILLLLASHPGQVFSLEEIYRQVWQQPDLGRTESARIRVAQMRHKLEDACPDRVFIVRFWGKGFVFRAE